MVNTISHCKSCASLNLVELNAEICFKFPGLNGLKKEHVLAYPKFEACLDCGFLQSTLSIGTCGVLEEAPEGVRKLRPSRWGLSLSSMHCRPLRC
jgi:hypothetical protein